ncbi:MAG: hypothetical protein RL033_2010 [Pseudomonadota bacterium]
MLWLAPLSPFDDLLTVSLLEKASGSIPSEAALHLRVEPDALQRVDCGVPIAAALRKSGALQWYALEPLQLLCPVPGAERVLRSSARRDALGRVAGWRMEGAAEPLSLAEWVRPLSSGALPTLDWNQLESGQVSPELLRGRQVLISAVLDETRDHDQLERSLAAAITGEGIRRRVPAWLLGLGAFAVAVGWAETLRRRGYRQGLSFALLLVPLVAGLSFGLAKFASVAILPLASLGVAWLTGAAAMIGPELVRERRSLGRANELMERAALSRVRGVDQLDDAEFHAKIAGLADQCHPANVVLVAQLPARKWHLIFWRYGSAGEELIDERRRDIRRTPYCDEQGVPTIRVVRNYLVMKDMPVLVVPLMALGEIEGYVFLCGDRAETAFRADSSVAGRLSTELGLMMRRRRLGRASLTELSAGGRRDSKGSGELASGAQLVSDEMELLDAMVRDAPVGLMLADSFGQVRMLSREFASWLASFGVKVPPLHDDAIVPAGALTLASVLEHLLAQPAEGASRRIAELVGSKDALRLTVTTPTAQGGEALTLRLRALRRTTLSVDHVTGFVATLVPTDAPGPSSRGASPVISINGVEELSAFPLASVVRDAIAGVNRTLKRQVLLEPSMSAAHCIGKKGQLTAALRTFLTDSAMQESPVLVLREKSRDLELIIHDLDLGVPAGALDRVMNAPHHPPAGLEALGRLILAVEDSHGSMRVVSGRGWGSRLILRLHRARSVMMVGHSRFPSARAVSEGPNRTSQIPPAPRRPAVGEPPGE